MHNFVESKIEFSHKSPPGLFNQAKLFTDLKKRLELLKPLVESGDREGVLKFISQEMMALKGDQSKFSPEYPQWHNYQTYIYYLAEMRNLIIDMKIPNDHSLPKMLGYQATE